ncbi:MAG: leucyl aminopeptidase family protein, partial [Xanthomonadales bacterium]|nr:leucyl aminopeptidase family protein [Xanthomonadales bacterium]
MDGWTEWRRNRRYVSLQTVSDTNFARIRKSLSSGEAGWLKSLDFKPKPGHTALLADAKGQLQKVLVGVADDDPLWALGALPFTLPPADYVLEGEHLPPLAALGWALGAYDFDRYRASSRAPARLALARAQIDALRARAQAVCLVRDLVNTPTADMGPTQLAEQIVALGKRYQARVRQWIGPQLLKHNFPTIHAVGRAATDAPRLVELRWGRKDDPKVTLVGKGVCFDTGGLDIKGSEGMRWMKKDMG